MTKPCLYGAPLASETAWDPAKAKAPAAASRVALMAEEAAGEAELVFEVPVLV